MGSGIIKRFGLPYLVSTVMFVLTHPGVSKGQHVHRDTLHIQDGSEGHAMRGILGSMSKMQMEGSGTSWHPEDSPMEGVHATRNNWELALHGRAFFTLHPSGFT